VEARPISIDFFVKENAQIIFSLKFRLLLLIGLEVERENRSPIGTLAHVKMTGASFLQHHYDVAGLSNNLSAPKSIQKIGSWYHVNPI
jgi:hypothetical protein